MLIKLSPEAADPQSDRPVTSTRVQNVLKLYDGYLCAKDAPVFINQVAVLRWRLYHAARIESTSLCETCQANRAKQLNSMTKHLVKTKEFALELASDSLKKNAVTTIETGEEDDHVRFAGLLDRLFTSNDAIMLYRPLPDTVFSNMMQRASDRVNEEARKRRTQIDNQRNQTISIALANAIRPLDHREAGDFFLVACKTFQHMQSQRLIARELAHLVSDYATDYRELDFADQKIFPFAMPLSFGIVYNGGEQLSPMMSIKLVESPIN